MAVGDIFHNVVNRDVDLLGSDDYQHNRKQLMTFSKEIERAIGYAAAVYQYEDNDVEACIKLALTEIFIESISEPEQEYLSNAVHEYAVKHDEAMESLANENDDDEDEDEDTWDETDLTA